MLRTLPFNFRYLKDSDNYVISNSVGAFSFLQSDRDVELLASGRADELPAAIQDELTAKNIISPEIEFERRVSLQASGVAYQWARSIEVPGLFMIVPTLRCDHSCSYCQVSRVEMHKEGYDLDEAYIDDVIKFISSISPTYPKIEFQGGEPLLAHRFVKLFIERASIELSDKNPSFVICSALGQYPEEFISWCKDQNVSFSISLDGDKSVHDKNRKSIYPSSYDHVSRNMERLRNEIGSERISCIATVSRHGLDFPDEMLREYVARGFNRVFFRPLSPFGFAVKQVEEKLYSVDEYFDFYKRSLAAILTINNETDFVDEMTLIYLRRLLQPGRQEYVDMKSPAGYIFGPVIINYDGNVFGSDESRMLWEMTKESTLVLGNISQGGEILNNQPAIELLSRTFTHCNPGCDECVYQAHCGSDPLHHLVTQGDQVGNKALSFYCRLQRKMFDHILCMMQEKSVSEVFNRWLTL